MALLLAFVIAAGLTVAAAVGGIRTVRRVRIGLLGRPAEASITGCGDGGWTTWEQHQWIVDYTTAGGERRTDVPLPPTNVRAPESGTRMTVHYEPRHPERVQLVRWEWERIAVTGLVGVPGCVIYAVVCVAPVIAAVTGAGWVKRIGIGAVHFGASTVPILGLAAGSLLLLGTLIAWERSPRLALGAGLAALSAGYLFIGGIPLVVLGFPLLLGRTGGKVLDLPVTPDTRGSPPP